MSVLGVILAGGLSTRMRGEDKSLMPLAGLPLIGHALNRLSSQVDRIIINTNGIGKIVRVFLKNRKPTTTTNTRFMQ